MKLFAVLDVKANHFQKPFADVSTVSALRGFEVAVNESKSVLNQFPDDFALVELGDFDVNSGKISPLSNPLNIGNGRSVLRQETMGTPVSLSAASRDA